MRVPIDSEVAAALEALWARVKPDLSREWHFRGGAEYNRPLDIRPDPKPCRYCGCTHGQHTPQCDMDAAVFGLHR